MCFCLFQPLNYDAMMHFSALKNSLHIPIFHLGQWFQSVGQGPLGLRRSVGSPTNKIPFNPILKKHSGRKLFWSYPIGVHGQG